MGEGVVIVIRNNIIYFGGNKGFIRIFKNVNFDVEGIL